MSSILAVDDQKVMRELVSAILVSEGHEVTLAEDGMEALKICKAPSQSFDMIISDINMPNMNGLSFIGSVRKLDAFKSTPILMLTTEGDAFKKDKAKRLGANGWLQKPFEATRLLSAINKMLGMAD